MFQARIPNINGIAKYAINTLTFLGSEKLAVCWYTYIAKRTMNKTYPILLPANTIPID
ncbi:MAG: hypothetical protein Tsb004_22830 [Allomuricauda sp.]